jgi:hypothetical protein
VAKVELHFKELFPPEQACAGEKQAQTCVCKGLGACASLARNAKMEIVA